MTRRLCFCGCEHKTLVRRFSGGRSEVVSNADSIDLWLFFLKYRSSRLWNPESGIIFIRSAVSGSRIFQNRLQYLHANRSYWQTLAVKPGAHDDMNFSLDCIITGDDVFRNNSTLRRVWHSYLIPCAVPDTFVYLQLYCLWQLNITADIFSFSLFLSFPHSFGPFPLVFFCLEFFLECLYTTFV